VNCLPETVTSLDGVLVVDKPEGWTSHDVVARVRRLANMRRVGHLGTLDPMATGVLPLVVGRATRLAQFFASDTKVYEGVIRFGYTTDSYDREGMPLSEPQDPRFSRDELEAAIDRFRGDIEQLPPPVSAKKIHGAPAYKLARKQVPVELKPVRVSISRFDLLSFDGIDAAVRVKCSAGTYLRSIAHDLGQMLGCGAFLQTLRRTASGEFGVDRSHTLSQLEELAASGELVTAIVPARELLPSFPNEIVDNFTATQIRHGRDFRVSPFRVRQGNRYVKAISPDGDLIAIGEVRLPNLYHPVLVLRGEN
jgi:tRNA pseudouridine55 synthase